MHLCTADSVLARGYTQAEAAKLPACLAEGGSGSMQIAGSLQMPVHNCWCACRAVACPGTRVLQKNKSSAVALCAGMQRHHALAACFMQSEAAVHFGSPPAAAMSCPTKAQLVMST